MAREQVKDMLMEHFMNPRNVGELPQADGVGEVGNPLCGDVIRLFLQIKDDRIQKATFKSFGCRAAIATSSILTEFAKGKSIQQAREIKKEDLAKALGNLPPLKQNCAKLAELALQAAIGDFLARTKGDSSLADQVQERIHNPQEWRTAASFDELEPAAAPL